MPTPILQLRQITVRRGSRTVLGSVDATVHGGEILAVVGPNGSGKSSLIAAVTGELPLASGDIHLLGEPLATLLRQPRQLARWRAVLPQQATLDFDFSVAQVVMMGRTPHFGRRLQARDDEICDEALREVEATHLAQRLYPTLSGGEQRRVQIARCWAQLHDPIAARQPCLALLDEPTNGLDLRHQWLVFQAIRRLADRGAAVVIVLHDLTQARQLADQVLLLAEGSTVALGTPLQALTPETIRRAYGVDATWLTSDPENIAKIASLAIHGIAQPIARIIAENP